MFDIFCDCGDCAKRIALGEATFQTDEGNNFYSGIFLEQMAKTYPLFMISAKSIPKPYHSTWRLLHIDGFEDRAIQFFKYEGLT